MSKKLKILMIISLLLNALLVSFIGGKIYQHKTMKRGPAPAFTQRNGLIEIEAGLPAARYLFGKTPPNHATEPRRHPCRSRPPQRVRGRGRRLSLGSGESGPTYNIGLDHKATCGKVFARQACLFFVFLVCSSHLLASQFVFLLLPP